MHINPKELQKFHDLWAPMIAALPAVINAVEHEMQLKANIETFQRQLNDAIVAIDTAKTDRLAAIDAANAKVVDLENQRRALTLAVKEHAESCKATIASAEEATAIKVAECAAKTAAMAATIAAIDVASSKRQAEANAVYEAQAKELNIAIAELELKRATAEEALNKLRMQLG